MRVMLILIVALAAAVLTLGSIDLSRVAIWAVDAQRGFQNQMAGAIRALKSGDVYAYIALLSATAAYGFVHALGPGHGKYLVGGVGLGTSVSVGKLVGLATASSLTQSLWAIILVYAGFMFIEVSAGQMTALAEDYLAPMSYLAIAGVGVLLVWRGSRSLIKAHKPLYQIAHHQDRVPPEGFSLAKRHALTYQTGFALVETPRLEPSPRPAPTYHDENCDCGAHGPTLDQAARVNSLREAMGLVLSIAIRPCTGAIFLLVIAWRMDLAIAGAVAVICMGLGTAALTSLVAISSVAARRVTALYTETHLQWRIVLPGIQVFSGAMIALISLSLLGFRLTL